MFSVTFFSCSDCRCIRYMCTDTRIWCVACNHVIQWDTKRERRENLYSDKIIFFCVSESTRERGELKSTSDTATHDHSTTVDALFFPNNNNNGWKQSGNNNSRLEHKKKLRWKFPTGPIHMHTQEQQHIVCQQMRTAHWAVLCLIPLGWCLVINVFLWKLNQQNVNLLTLCESHAVRTFFDSVWSECFCYDSRMFSYSACFGMWRVEFCFWGKCLAYFSLTFNIKLFEFNQV